MIFSKNMGTWLFVIDVKVNQPHEIRLLQIHQNSTIKDSKLSVWSKGLGCYNIRWQASGFNGMRPRNNPIWCSQREGTSACNTDVKATDLTAQASLWAGPPRPSIMNCDWLIKIYNFLVLCTLSVALEKTTSATWKLRSLSSLSWITCLIHNVSHMEKKKVPVGFTNVFMPQDQRGAFDILSLTRFFWRKHYNACL